MAFFGRGDDLDENNPYWREKLAAFNVVLGEDNENLPWIRRSTESGALEGVPLSCQERRIYHFHEYVDQVIGLENIPAHLRVAPRRGPLQKDGRGRRAA